MQHMSYTKTTYERNPVLEDMVMMELTLVPNSSKLLVCIHVSRISVGYSEVHSACTVR